MKKLLTIISVLAVALCTGLVYVNAVSLTTTNYVTAQNRTGMTLNWEMGNNDGSTTAYDTAPNRLNAVETGTMTFVEGVDGYIQYIGGGAANYMSYSPGIDPIGGNAEISIAMKYQPSVVASEGNNRVVFDTSGTQYKIGKSNAGQTLQIMLGDTIIDEISLAVFGKYWKVGEDMIIVIVSSATTDRTDVYINGDKVVDQDTTAWAEGAVTEIFGAGGNSGSAGKGNWYYLKTWDRLLTAQEIANLSADRVNYVATPNRTGIMLDLNMGNNDGTSVIYDTSGTGANGATTNGATLTNDYVDLDGTDQAVTSVGTGIFNTATTSIAIKFTPDFAVDGGTSRHWFDSSVGSRYLLSKDGASGNLSLYLGDSNIASVPVANYQDYFKVGEKNVIVISGTTGDTSMWLNGYQIISNAATAWTPDDPAVLHIGERYNSSRFFDGKIYYFKVWDRIMTANEVANLSANRTNYKR